MVRILPVLDVLEGRVVRGVAGKRSEYRPIVSNLTTSDDPFAVVSAIKNTFGLTKFYLADLDGILHERPNRSLYRRLADAGFLLLADAGCRNRQQAAALLSDGVHQLIVALEYCESPSQLSDIISQISNVTFSLDLKNGVPVRPERSQGWSKDPCEIMRQAVDCGTRSILVLDLLDVGMNTGGSTDRLCQFAKKNFPSIPVLTGGGVRGPSDLWRLEQLGIDAVLVASALHDGRLTRSDVEHHTAIENRAAKSH